MMAAHGASALEGKHGMALFLVVRHQGNKDQRWANKWLDDDRLQTITTTPQIGDLCEAARIAGERVFVHRCGWKPDTPLICCSVKVAKVTKLDGRASIEFTEPTVLGCEPPIRPAYGQSFYEAAPVC
jgi:hypothetical protein